MNTLLNELDRIKEKGKVLESKVLKCRKCIKHKLPKDHYILCEAHKAKVARLMRKTFEIVHRKEKN